MPRLLVPYGVDGVTTNDSDLLELKVFDDNIEASKSESVLFKVSVEELNDESGKNSGELRLSAFLVW